MRCVRSFLVLCELSHDLYGLLLPQVAPNQYEFAPLYGTVTTQIDQNLIVMQVIEEIAVKHGLAALLHEKPFQVSLSFDESS